MTLLFNVVRSNCFLFLMLLLFFIFISCGRKGDLERPPSADGLEAPEIVEDRVYKY